MLVINGAHRERRGLVPVGTGMAFYAHVANWVQTPTWPLHHQLQVWSQPGVTLSFVPPVFKYFSKYLLPEEKPKKERKFYPGARRSVVYFRGSGGPQRLCTETLRSR